MLFFGGLFLILFICGIWATINPRSAFLFGRRWQFESVEPSQAALLMTRIIGIISLIIVGSAAALVLYAVIQIAMGS